MLMVDARRGPSSIHGLGLIAHQPVPAGTVVWKFQLYFDQLIPPDMVDRLSPPAKEQFKLYASFDDEDGYFILSGDDDRFTNHSDRPNTEVRGSTTVAVRDIAAGEEITINYGDIGLHPFC